MPDRTPSAQSCGLVCVAINSFFRGVVTAALNPLLDLLSNTLLATPNLDSLPGLGGLWSNSWQILLACYGLLVLVAAVVIMSFETLQTRYTIKEIAPRIVAGFLAGALSLWAATRAVEITNGLSRAVLGAGLDPRAAGDALRNITFGSLNDGIFLIFVGLFLAGMLLALLVGYVIRVALTVILVAGAPIALMFHALPQTEHIAYWWWKAFGGCLAIQIVQSLTLVTAMRVFLTPGGFTLFGPTTTGLVNMLVACALMYILYKIPFWVLGSLRGGGGRSLVGSLVRGFIAYKTFGLLSGRGGRRAAPGVSRGGGRHNSTPAEASGGTPDDPYANVRADADGQYALPLTGLRRVRPPRRRRGDATPAPRPAPHEAGRQLVLPLGEDWPENRPVLGRDGQYRLPLDVDRVPRPAGAGSPTPRTRSRRARRRGVQLELPFDPYKGNRAGRDGQYPLPLDGVHRVPRPESPAPVAPSPRRRASTTARGRQLELPFDPYKGNRPDRTGQYALPLEGVRRVPRPAVAKPAAPGRAGTPRPAGQLQLPLGLPKPAKPGTASAPATSRPAAPPGDSPSPPISGSPARAPRRSVPRPSRRPRAGGSS